MGDYCRPTYASHVSMGLLQVNPANFNIKYDILSYLRDKPFNGNTTSDPWEHMGRFHEITLMCHPEGIIEDRVKLKLSH